MGIFGVSQLYRPCRSFADLSHRSQEEWDSSFRTASMVSSAWSAARCYGGIGTQIHIILYIMI